MSTVACIQPKIRSTIIQNEWVSCLSNLRDARALILRNAESFHEAATALEQVGQVLSGKIRNSLSKYEPELLELTTVTGRHEITETARLFNVIREARNDAVHEGAWARHLNSRLIDLFLILEESIMSKLTCIEDIMVRNPVIAEPWHMVAHIRKTMLANSFSFLPILWAGEWHFVSDTMIMRYLHGASNRDDKKERLQKQIQYVIQAGEIKPTPAVYCPPKNTIVQLLAEMVDGPILVVEEAGGTSRLLGIVTSFDLL